jgi:hypothetical protein|tara:strand:+ start:955 stop:1833 length:879 start_codon:yes stop_codon:yes gene_type:complete
MPGIIDLHCHTIASDGELSPEELVDLAIKKELKAIAITDHDSLGSLKKAIDYSKGKNIEVIPGVEISSNDLFYDFDKIDVVGLFVDYNNKSLANTIEYINKKRDENKREVIKKLNNLGFKIDFNEVKKTVKGTFGRPHIAKFLLKKYPSEFSSIRDVFDKYIEKGKAAFVKPTEMPPIKDTIKIINKSNGISILAHPGVYPKECSLKLINHFIDMGGDGIETYYPYHIICPNLNLDEKGNNEMVAFYKDIARYKNILEGGGGDYHGEYRFTLGELKIPDEILSRIKNKLNIS